MADREMGSELDLSRGSLYTLQPYLINKPGIKILNLSVNMLKSLPIELGDKQDMEVFKCSNNQFKEFPIVLCKLVRLETLDLAGNMLRDLPRRVGDLTKLTKVSLGWNNFKQFPVEICQASALTELHLSNNRITTVSEQISNLRQLKIFDISHNKIKTLPSFIGDLISLTSLNVSNNDIANLPDDICKLQSLKTMKATTNHITALPHHFGASLHQLTLLNVEGNPLEDPPIDICQQGIAAIKTYQDEKWGPLYDEVTDENQEPEIGVHRTETNRVSNTMVTFRKDDDINNNAGPTKQRKLSLSSTRLCDRRLIDDYALNLDLSQDGIFNFIIKPDAEKTKSVTLSDNMKFEIPPNAVNEEVTITTEVVDAPPCPVALGDHEFVVTDFLELSPDGLRFQEPIIFTLKYPDELKMDKTREIVVRTTNGNGTWSDLKTWQEGDVIKAEVEHFSGLLAVSKPRVHSFILPNIGDISVSCVDDDISVDLKAPRDTETINISMELQKIERDILLRACELVDGYQDDDVAMGNILKLHQVNGTSSKPITLSLQVPELSEPCDVTGQTGRNKGSVKVIMDHNDDNWCDVTDDVIYGVDGGKSITFKHKLPRSTCRYTTIIADPEVNVLAIAQRATSMARKRSKIVNMVLLQNVRNPHILYVDCVVKEKFESLFSRLLQIGYETRGMHPNTRDIDLPEGEKIALDIGGEHISEQRSKDNNLTFYSRRDNHVKVHVSLGNSACAANIAPGNDCVGHVHFVKADGHTFHVQNRRNSATRIDTLYFGVPKPEVFRPSGLSPISAGIRTNRDNIKGDVDIAVDILSSGLLGRDWKRLARRLGLSDPEIDILESDHSRDTREQIHQMFQKWRQKNGNKATVNMLLDALEEEEIRNLAHEIKKRLGLNRSTNPRKVKPSNLPRPKTSKRVSPSPLSLPRSSTFIFPRGNDQTADMLNPHKSTTERKQLRLPTVVEMAKSLDLTRRDHYYTNTLSTATPLALNPLPKANAARQTRRNSRKLGDIYQQ
uniref:P53-induced protein with a death domain-like n=1 Tax=Saccoglossus kowalevskii TaxID=10224 RepID=A0ABM0M573_SACKO|nr:PREDICTED: p53-induced protein with a death domain-like [Saccoglossus kowalevskii]